MSARLDDIAWDEGDSAPGPRCLLCGGEGVYLGSGGGRDWYRCRHCGAVFSKFSRPSGRAHWRAEVVKG